MGWSLSCFFLLIFIEMFLKSDAKKMRGFPSKRSSKAVFKVPTRYITSPDSLKSNHAKPCLIGTMDARHFRQILRKCQASFRRQHQFWNVLILQAHGPPRWLWRFYKTSMWSLAAKKTAGWFAEPGMLGRCFEANSTWCTSAEWEFTVRGLGPTIDSDWGGRQVVRKISLITPMCSIANIYYGCSCIIYTGNLYTFLTFLDYSIHFPHIKRSFLPASDMGPPNDNDVTLMLVMYQSYWSWKIPSSNTTLKYDKYMCI